MSDLVDEEAQDDTSESDLSSTLSRRGRHDQEESYASTPTRHQDGLESERHSSLSANSDSSASEERVSSSVVLDDSSRPVASRGTWRDHASASELENPSSISETESSSPGSSDGGGDRKLELKRGSGNGALASLAKYEEEASDGSRTSEERRSENSSSATSLDLPSRHTRLSGRDVKDSDRKRSAGTLEETFERPSKRVRPIPKANSYLDLLNRDIYDVALQYGQFDVSAAPTSQVYDQEPLSTSQIGMCVWTSAEKHRFFEALCRLGRHDSAGIAKRIGSKGELEVRQYLALLRQGVRELVTTHSDASFLAPSEMPAAVEIGEECCKALDKAADHLAAQLDQLDRNALKQKYDGNSWLVNKATLKGRDTERGKSTRPTDRDGDFFRTETWLDLTQKAFRKTGLNLDYLPIPPLLGSPGIRAQALNDFEAIVRSFTSRLTAVAAHVATSRVRASRTLREGTSLEVSAADINAANELLGLLDNSWQHWIECAKRLDLDVIHDTSAIEVSRQVNRSDIMSQTAVEAVLHEDPGGKKDSGARKRYLAWKSSQTKAEPVAERTSTTDVDEISETEDSGTDTSNKDESTTTTASLGGDHSDGDSTSEEQRVLDELEELLEYSAWQGPRTASERTLCIKKLQAEHRREEYADSLDRLASYDEEKRLWALLGEEPPTQMGAESKVLSPEIADSPSEPLDMQAPDWTQCMRFKSEWENGYNSDQLGT